MILELEKYIPLFAEKNITGPQLIQLDGTKLKVETSFAIKFFIEVKCFTDLSV